MQKFLVIYCDGACSGNPGPGGWGAVLIWGDSIKEISGYENTSTNNRMELTAAIEALKQVSRPVKIKIYTDSTYVMRGITDWISTWKRNKWNGGKIKNVDLWQKLDDISQKFIIEWNWVRGHSGDKYNEIADKLARQAIETNYKK
ncbi:ribonuclease H [endosymbiont of Acanthamoeba sp. UWC8]|uniref:ribonuclease HI n=1 Tax=endosymbiont of Acanthamoeba sp. UWC8 TaxID=86106 RepID=UPI0004D0FB89|nr:ribonuclease HI [endosymbiont of Acanthamoeba sp. UWC8]AIF80573.1 ribonuclease H [endosymbiont of Acanthamoeba sp. UWC8]